jgi:FeS assembly SUF system regulator
MGREVFAMLRMSRLTDYGTLILSRMAQEPAALHTASSLAERTRLGPATVAKILKALAHAGLVSSQRGAHGGYRLARPAEHITACEIIDALEGPVAITECAGHQCELESICGVGGAWQRINAGIRRALDDITLEQLVTWKRGPLPHFDLGMQTGQRA